MFYIIFFHPRDFFGSEKIFLFPRGFWINTSLLSSLSLSLVSLKTSHMGGCILELFPFNLIAIFSHTENKLNLCCLNNVIFGDCQASLKLNIFPGGKLWTNVID